MILDGYITIIRDAIYGDAITTGSHIAIGTGSTAVAGSDTALETEISRKTCSNSKSGSDTAAFESTWASVDNNGVTFTEVGAVNASSSGTFLNRQVFPGFEKTSDYELRIQIYIKSENN